MASGSFLTSVIVSAKFVFVLFFFFTSPSLNEDVHIVGGFLYGIVVY